MSEHLFGGFKGHLTKRLSDRVERKFPQVTVVNYTEPRGEKRGWFAGPNRGHPFDGVMAREVLEYARSIAKGEDSEKLVDETSTKEDRWHDSPGSGCPGSGPR